MACCVMHILLFLGACAAAWVPGALAGFPDPTWPLPDAPYTLRIVKQAGLENDTEPQWMHLHSDNPAAYNLAINIQAFTTGYAYSCCQTVTGVQVRYTLLGFPISGWLNPPALAFTLSHNSAVLAPFNDGVLDLSLEVKGANRLSYKVWPSFLHLKRGRALGDLVPIMAADEENHLGQWGLGVERLRRTERRATRGWAGYPANPNLTPWTTEPRVSPLYLEQLTPGTGLFEPLQMWWEDLPSHPGLSFIRGFQMYQGEDPRGLDHRALPAKDGPRGVGWMSSYVQGKVDAAGRLFFAELSGRVGMVLPTGEIITLAGWVTHPSKDPVWIRKPLSVIRSSQVLRGTWPSFAPQGFGRPMDVALNPAAPGVLYVPDLTRHCIWTLRLMDVNPSTGIPGRVQVELLAGSQTGTSGFQDGVGPQALFNEPYSATLGTDPSGTQVLYVSDSANHAVRRVSLGDGRVTTVWGGPDMEGRLTTELGVADIYDRAQLRAAMRVTVSASEAAAGVTPHLFWPTAIRSDSSGWLLLMEHGLGYIRRLDPASGEVVMVVEVNQIFGENYHGWAWFDVDTTGAAGPKDGIYWCQAVGENIVGEEGRHFNEIFAWSPPAGGGSQFIFTGRGGGANPIGFGERIGTTPPHYPWLVAVDPRGGVLMMGMGGHGMHRLRLMEVGDPTATESWDYYRGYLSSHNLGKGTWATSLTHRFGDSGHTMLGTLRDAWATRSIASSCPSLMAHYGINELVQANREYKTTMCAYLQALTGPTRDPPLNPAAAPPLVDTLPPTTPSWLIATADSKTTILIKWRLSSDNVAVAGYHLQVGLTAGFSALLQPYNNVFVGNTELLLVEGLASKTRYHLRLRAKDKAGNSSPWSTTVNVMTA